MLYNKIESKKREHYCELLALTGSLSKLFNDSNVPYLHYRAHENIYCLSLEADNLSRSDLSVDARIGKVGIGLKTFLHGNGNTLQKIAEFNSVSHRLKNLSPEETIREIAQLRNKRIESTKVQYGLENSIYHLLTRSKDKFSIFETNLDLIESKNIELNSFTEKTFVFNDGINEYSYNISKSTLYKRFILKKPIHFFEVKILDNPFKDLFKLKNLSISKQTNTLQVGVDYIYLPLYSTRDQKNFEPSIGSGLNQWNAKGRVRHPDEVYIPVPAWIHNKCKGFLPDNNDDTFEIELPNRELISAKLCQSGSKGLMSNPNKALGKWILRDILKLKPGEIVTRKVLDDANFDSVLLTKTGDRKYKIDFAGIGKYQNFENLFN